MFALVASTPDSAWVVAVSESRDKLRSRLKEEATEYCMEMCSYDEDDFNELWKEDIDKAQDLFVDHDTDYFWKLKISKVDVI